MYKCDRNHTNSVLGKKVYVDDVVSDGQYIRMSTLEQTFFTHDEDIIDTVIELGVAAVTLGVFDDIFDGNNDNLDLDEDFDFGGGDGGGGGASDDY